MGGRTETQSETFQTLTIQNQAKAARGKATPAACHKVLSLDRWRTKRIVREKFAHKNF